MKQPIITGSASFLLTGTCKRSAYLFACSVSFHSSFCRLLICFKISLFNKAISRTLSECQAVWIQIRTDILSVLVWVQIVCKGYQQATEVAASIARVKGNDHLSATLTMMPYVKPTHKKDKVFQQSTYKNFTAIHESSH